MLGNSFGRTRQNHTHKTTDVSVATAIMQTNKSDMIFLIGRRWSGQTSALLIFAFSALIFSA